MHDKPRPPAAAIAPMVPGIGATAVVTGAGTSARRRFVSEQIFGDSTEVEIQHGASIYRLRLTSLGKLILTK